MDGMYSRVLVRALAAATVVKFEAILRRLYSHPLEPQQLRSSWNILEDPVRRVETGSLSRGARQAIVWGAARKH